MVDLTDRQLKEIGEAYEVLKQGGIILYPTDTIWGLGCDAANSDAIERLYGLKGRKRNKPFIILVDGLEMLSTYVPHIPQSALSLLHSTQKPLTIIFPDAQNLPSQLPADDGSIGIRIVNHPFCTPVLEMLGGAITSTSANFSGTPAPAIFGNISNDLLLRTDFVVDPDLFSAGSTFSSALYKVINDTKITCLRE